MARGDGRKYYRFRADRWYGGIATADAVGCGLLCKFCWVSDKVRNRPNDVGSFYTPRSVAGRLMAIASSKRFRQVRISGGEPTIGREHLIAVIREFQGHRYTFILETNGILIGHFKGYAEDISPFPFVHVRVSLKGCTADEFTVLTGAKPDGFELQLRAVKNLVDAGVNCWVAVMGSFSTGETFSRLAERIATIDEALAQRIEIEELILYPRVEARLKREGIRYYRAYKPGTI